VIFLIDASVYVFRAYHSALPMVDRDGNPVKVASAADVMPG